MPEVTKGQGLVGRAPIPGYSQGGRVVHDPLCVPARLACPSPHANQAHPVQKKRIQGREARSFMCTATVYSLPASLSSEPTNQPTSAAPPDGSGTV